MGEYTFKCGCGSIIAIKLTPDGIPKIDQLEKEGKGLPYYCSICKKEQAVWKL